MNKNKISWIGLGQAGGNIVQMAENKYGYNCMYLNTSKEDLSSLKNVKYPIHIPNGIGAAKDRKAVIKLMSESIEEIISKIDNLITGDIVFVVFSAGGGTGSGSSSFICKYLVQTGKIVVPIVVLPDDSESAKSAENSYNCVAELSQIDGLGGTFLLDNSKVNDKFSLNSKFVADIDVLLSVNHSSQLGNIDEAEIRTLLSCSGVSVIARCSKAKSTAVDIMQGWHKGIYAEIESKTAMYLGISTSNKSLENNSLTKEFSGIFDVFTGISDATTIAILTGLQWPMKRIEKFKHKFEQVVNTININIQHKPKFESLRGSSFTQPIAQKNTPSNPRDILMDLLNN